MRQRRRARGAERRIQYELRLQARDPVDGEPPAALEVLDELLEAGVEVVAGHLGERLSGELFEALPQPAHVIAAHAGAERPEERGLRPPQHKEFAEPEVGELRDRYARFAAPDQEPCAVRAERGHYDLVRRALFIDEREDRRAVDELQLRERAALPDAGEPARIGLLA